MHIGCMCTSVDLLDLVFTSLIICNTFNRIKYLLIHSCLLTILKVQSLIHIILEHQIKFKTYRGILIYPNSGEEWDASQGNWVEGNGCADVTQFASEIMKGVRYVHDTCRKENAPLVPLVVGGCCRTSQETIRAIRCSLDSYIRC